EQHPGVEHRVFITARGDYAVARREPPFVIGDGVSSIVVLAEAESRRRTTPRLSSVGPIKMDEEADSFLARRGRGRFDVPREGERIRVRANSNLSTGATCTDVTEQVHPSMIEISMRALEAMAPLQLAGIDFLSVDPSAPQDAAGYVILEVNPLPAIGMHMAPA